MIGKLYNVIVFGTTPKGANQKIDDLTLPYIYTEPNEKDLLVFLRNFRPYLYSKMTSITYNYIRDMHFNEH